MSRRIDLNDLRLLLQVVDHGGFTAAARASGVPKSTLSLRIAQLEAAVGAALLRRTSRSLSLTEAGTRVVPHARAIEALAREIENAVVGPDDEPWGTLRVSCSHAVAQYALFPILPRFLAAHPGAAVEVEAANRLVDLVGEGYDMAIRGHSGPLKNSVLVQRVVARTPWALAASPAWIATHGLPTSPGDIPVHQTLCFSHAPERQAWSLTRDGVERKVELVPRLVSDEMLSLRASAIADGGIVCLPGYLLAPALRAGELVRLLPDWRCQTATISVLTPPKPQSTRLAGLFSAFLAAELPKMTRFDEP